MLFISQLRQFNLVAAMGLEKSQGSTQGETIGNERP